MPATKPNFKFSEASMRVASFGFALFWALASVAYAPPPAARPLHVELGKKPEVSGVGAGNKAGLKPLSKVLRESVARSITELKTVGKASKGLPAQGTTIRSKWIQDGASSTETKLGASIRGDMTEEQAAIRFSHWSKAMHDVKEERHGLIVQHGETQLHVRSEEFNEVFDAFWGGEDARNVNEANWSKLGTLSDGLDGTEPIKRFQDAVLKVFRDNKHYWASIDAKRFDPTEALEGFQGSTSAYSLREGQLFPTSIRQCLVVERPEEVRIAREKLGKDWWTKTQVVWNRSGSLENVREQMARVPGRITVLHGMPRTEKEGQEMHGEAFGKGDLHDVERCRADAALFVTPDAEDGTLKSLRHMRQRNVDLALAEIDGAKTMAEKAKIVIQRATEEDLVIQLGCVSGTDMVFADKSRLPLDHGNIKCQLFLLGCQTALKTDIATDQARIGTLRNVTYREARTVVRSFRVTKHAAFSIMEHLMRLESKRRWRLTPEAKVKHVDFGPKSPFIMIANMHSIEIQAHASSATAFVPSRVSETRIFAFHTSRQP